jgi:uroporphyrin-III C-methyltransferase/precorrin-2 dehydrogenase/sirohydrochlorin ferrochelatase
VFLDLKGRRVVVAGDGDGAVWKAELAAAAGGNVQVYAPQPGAELLTLQRSPPAGSIEVVARSWTADDLSGAHIAIGALEGEEGEAFAVAAGKLGVPVNVVDTPGLSTFSFGTIINRAPVTVAVGTDGSAPVLGQAIRARIEALLHPALGSWVQAAKGLRDIVKARLPMGPARREIWRRFADRALAATSPPQTADLEALFRAETREGGSVALVGAGPGDPELLTLKALRALQSADVVLHDRLVSPAILEMARREARRILVGKAAGAPSCRQDDINALMVNLALEGKRVVRLKGGDPTLFGRAAEEIAACRAAAVPLEIVPGITAALGAAAQLQIPLTDRRFAKRVQFVTGHSEKGIAPEHDWQGLSDPWTTTVFYMGSRTFAEMLPKMLAAGLDPATPAAAITSATTDRTAAHSGTAAELPVLLKDIHPAEPCLIVLGRVLEAGLPGEAIGRG